MSSSSSPFSGVTPWYGEPEQHRQPLRRWQQGPRATRRGGRELTEVGGEGRFHCWAALRGAPPRRARPQRQAGRTARGCVPQADALQAHLLVSRAQDALDVRREPWGPALHPGEALAAVRRGGPALGELARRRESPRARASRQRCTRRTRFQPGCRKGRMNCSTAHVTLCDAMLTRMSATGSTSCAA